MKKIFSSMLVVMAMVAFTACNATGEVPSSPKTNDNSLAKTVAALVDKTADDAASALEKAGYELSLTEKDMKAYKKVVNEKTIVVDFTIKNDKVTQAHARVEAATAADLKKLTVSSDSYFYGLANEVFVASVITETLQNMYMEGSAVEELLSKAKSTLETMYKAGLMSEEDYNEAVAALNANVKKHSEFTSDVNGLSTSTYWDVQGLYGKYADEQKKNGYSYVIAAVSNGTAEFYADLYAAYGVFDVPSPNLLNAPKKAIPALIENAVRF